MKNVHKKGQSKLNQTSQKLKEPSHKKFNLLNINNNKHKYVYNANISNENC